MTIYAEEKFGNLILVMLRQPYLSDPTEMRSDPFWEFGSFGVTGCHASNIMNTRRLGELNGMRLGFAQNGPLGVKLIYVTPSISTSVVGHRGEASWAPVEMPMTYCSAPILVNNQRFSDFPIILNLISDARRSSWVAKFASKFRSRRLPLSEAVSREVISTYIEFRNNRGNISQSYNEALPYNPPKVDRDRKSTYDRLKNISYDMLKESGFDYEARPDVHAKRSSRSCKN